MKIASLLSIWRRLRPCPNLLQELGRLREFTFRAAGEGTGEHTDIDRFDFHYKHLLLWSKKNQELVGAYRMGLTAEILPAHGIEGLYTSTLFRYDGRMFKKLGPAVELGRSFVRLEYQRQFAPLLMLWKGIGHYLAAHPELLVLFGAVSVSSRYNQVSRELIVRFFQAREKQHELMAAGLHRAVPSGKAGPAPKTINLHAKKYAILMNLRRRSQMSRTTAKVFPSSLSNTPS